MKRELLRVQRARQALERAQENYRRAMAEAHEAGCSYERIGEAAGITPAGAHRVVNPRNPRDT